MPLEDKIKSGIMIGACALALYGVNFHYHSVAEKSCNNMISIRKFCLSLNTNLYTSVKADHLTCRIMHDLAHEKHYLEDADKLQEQIYELKKEVEDTGREIEKYREEKHNHSKRKLNPFYRLFR